MRSRRRRRLRRRPSLFGYFCSLLCFFLPLFSLIFVLLSFFHLFISILCVKLPFVLNGRLSGISKGDIAYLKGLCLALSDFFSCYFFLWLIAFFLFVRVLQLLIVNGCIWVLQSTCVLIARLFLV